MLRSSDCVFGSDQTTQFGRSFGITFFMYVVRQHCTSHIAARLFHDNGVQNCKRTFEKHKNRFLPLGPTNGGKSTIHFPLMRRTCTTLHYSLPLRDCGTNPFSKLRSFDTSFLHQVQSSSIHTWLGLYLTKGPTDNNIYFVKVHFRVGLCIFSHYIFGHFFVNLFNRSLSFASFLL